MKEIVIGVTLLFKKNNIEVISGVLKSVVIISTKKDLEKNIDLRANEISKFYDYKFIGINDVFFVSGEIKQGEILGRITDYDLDTLSKAESIVSKEFSFDNRSESEQFNCSLVYLCRNFNDDNFTISVITILNSLASSVIEDANKIANNISFVEKIKSNSIEDIKAIEYIGIEDIGEIDLKFGVFQSFYAEFNEEEALKDEIMDNREILSKLNEIVKK